MTACDQFQSELTFADGRVPSNQDADPHHFHEHAMERGEFSQSRGEIVGENLHQPRAGLG